MSTSPYRRMLTVSVFAFALLASATPTRAQGYVAPLFGYDFGGNSGCPDVQGCQDKRLNLGVSLGALGAILGAELEIADARNFFGDVSGQSSSVVTVMGNVMLVPRLGPVHPYVLGGVGLMKTHVDFSTATLIETRDSSLAADVGGGVFVFVARHLGFRGDVRHFHSLQRTTIPFVGTTFDNERVSFRRLSGSVVLGF